MQDLSTWLQATWADREDRVYPALFGTPTAYVAGEAPFRALPCQAHPGWLHHTVLAFAPTAQRASFVYVTSGLSNPWNLDAPGKDPTGFSGLGFELVLETTSAAAFAPALLHNLMAYELAVAVGSYPGQQLFEYGNRIPLRASLDPSKDSALRWLLVERPEHYPSAFELAAGRVDFFHLVGASDAEIAFLQQTSHDRLIALLRLHSACPCTNVERACLRPNAR